MEAQPFDIEVQIPRGAPEGTGHRYIVAFSLRVIGPAGIDEATALNNVILHKVLPKLTLDTARTGSDGLIGLRNHLDANLDRKAIAPNVEDCFAMLDRLIKAAEATEELPITGSAGVD
ncbi:MAG: hypothetical protein E5X65_20680 [Mesorhizobium sp.]|nr:MAG: hypothetical protein E5X65_20680 [Mesorhizobium sp.]